MGSFGKRCAHVHTGGGWASLRARPLCSNPEERTPTRRRRVWPLTRARSGAASAVIGAGSFYSGRCNLAVSLN